MLEDYEDDDGCDGDDNEEEIIIEQDDDGFYSYDDIFEVNQNDTKDVGLVRRFMKKYMGIYYAAQPPLVYHQNRTGCRNPIRWQNMVDIYHLGLQSSGAGGPNMNTILESFGRIWDGQDIPTIQGERFNMPLPNQWKTIYNVCNKLCDDLYTIIDFQYTLPEQFFGADPTLKKMTCNHFHIGEVIAAQLLDVTDKNNFRHEPDEQYEFIVGDSGDKERYYEDYSSGDHFIAFNKAIKEAYGPDAVALAVAFSHDESTLNTTRSRSKDPLIISISNIINADHCHSLMGFIPSQHTGYTDIELRELLNKRGYKAANFQTEILRYVQRDIKLQYIASVFEPLLELGKNEGISLLVCAKDPVRFKCFPHVILAHGDSLAMDYLAGTHHGKEKHKCRLCITEHCNNLSLHSNNMEYRNTEEMMSIAENAAAVMTRKAARELNVDGSNRRRVPRSADEGKTDNQIEQAASFWNMKPGYNPLVRFVEWQESNGGFNQFFGMFPPDFLHTFQKGFLEYSVSWTLVSVLCVQRLAKHASLRKYASCAVLLDQRVKHFPMKQSLNLTKGVFLRNGIMAFMKDSSATSASINRGTALLSGTIEAWKLGPMALQLMFALSDDILPYEQGWLNEAIGGKAVTTSGTRWNILRTCVNALTSTMEVMFFWRKTRMSESEIIHLDRLVQQARTHLMLLWFMRMDLLASLATTKRNPSDGPKKKGAASSSQSVPGRGKSGGGVRGGVVDDGTGAEIKETTRNFAG